MKNNLNESVQFIQKRTDARPAIGIILGSGLGSFADTLEDAVKIPTSEIPHYPVSTVEGHKGYLVFGKWNGSDVLAVQGRTHFYEGYPIERVTYVVRIMAEMGVKVLIVTNAAGGVNPKFVPGDLMLITDHINFMFDNPLIGPLQYGGERFPDMSKPYATDYYPAIEKIGLEKEIALRSGVLFVSPGPSYETAAEVKMIQRLGGDVASMSTVPEVIVANHAGLEVIGISCVTNMATGISASPLSHEEVTQTANQVKVKFISLVTGIIEYLAKNS
jgi:purine-nucleoside phosphorylase